MQIDVKLSHFEITQGLQIHDNLLPLVAGSPTIIRVIPAVDQLGVEVAGVSARLSAYRNGELKNSPIAPDNGPITVTSLAWRGDNNTSLDFTLEPAWCQQDTQFVAWLVLPAGIEDLNLDNNAWIYSARFHPRSALRIGYVRVNFCGVPPRPRVTTQVACNYVRSLYPISPNHLTYEPSASAMGGEFSFDELENGGVHGAKLIRELYFYFLADHTCDQLYGWTPENSFVHNGRSDPKYTGGHGLVAFGNDTGIDLGTSRWRRTLAHEIAHMTDERGLVHPATVPSSPTYYPHQLQDDEFGYDVLRTDEAQRVVMRLTLDNRNVFDFMVGDKKESEAWIGRRNYRRLFESLEPTEAEVHAEDTESTQQLGPNDIPLVVLLQGIIHRSGVPGSGEIIARLLPLNEKLHKLAEMTPVGAQGMAEVWIYHDRGEEGISRIGWEPSFVDPGGKPVDSVQFTWALADNPTNVTRVALRFRGTEIASFEVLPPPSLYFPPGSISLLRKRTEQKDIFELSWVIKKVDEGSTAEIGFQQVYYTHDKKTWHLVASGHEGKENPNVKIETANLPRGESSFFWILSSDGYNVSRSDFLVPDGDSRIMNPPRPRIISPEDGQEFAEGAALCLLGYGWDFGQRVEPERLVWHLNSERLGDTGGHVVVRGVSPGDHTVYLRVDGDDRSQDAVQICVTPSN